MTFEFFASVFATLATQLRAMDADEAMARAYFVALKDIEPEFVAEAAQRMAKLGGAVDDDTNRHWFPKTSEWRTEAVRVERDKYQAQAQLFRQRMKAGLPPLCLDCADTGWRVIEGERAVKCDCAKLRRLEILGRRPWPALPAGDAA